MTTTLGDTSIRDLLKAAMHDLDALWQTLQDRKILNADDERLVKAYVGSIGARIAVADLKIKEGSTR